VLFFATRVFAPPIPTLSLSLTTASSERHPNLCIGWTDRILVSSLIVFPFNPSSSASLPFDTPSTMRTRSFVFPPSLGKLKFRCVACISAYQPRLHRQLLCLSQRLIHLNPVKSSSSPYARQPHPMLHNSLLASICLYSTRTILNYTIFQKDRSLQMERPQERRRCIGSRGYPGG